MTEVAEATDKVPSREFLLMLVILLRKSTKETGSSLVQFLEDFEQDDPDFNPNMEVDAYDDRSLRRAIHKYTQKHYPPAEQPQFNPEDLQADDESPAEALKGFIDDEPDEELPKIEQLPE